MDLCNGCNSDHLRSASLRLFQSHCVQQQQGNNSYKGRNRSLDGYVGRAKDHKFKERSPSEILRGGL